MEKLHKTRAIVLRKKEWRESDLLFSLFTKDFGKIKAIATGSRKIRSKLIGHLSNFGVIELIFVKGKTFNRITHSYLVDAKYFDEASFKYLSVVQELLDASLQQELKVEEIWKMTRWVQDQIQKTEDKTREVLLNIYILKLLKYLGYKIDTENKRYNQEIGIRVSEHLIELIKKIQDNKSPDFSINLKDNVELSIFLKKYVRYFFEKDIKSLRML